MIPIRAWLILGAAAVVLVVAGWWHFAQVHKAEQAVHAHYATVLADISAKTAKAAEQFRQTETGWRDAFDKEARDGRTKLDAARRDAAAAGAAADGLQRALDRFRAAARAAEGAGAAQRGAGEPGGDPLDLLAKLLAGHSAELVAVAGYADELRVRGLACERAVDALTEHPSSNP